MEDEKHLYHGYRFHPTIISHAVWRYHRFCLSLRNVEDLLAERGIAVSYESIRQWCNRFGPEYALNLKKRQGRLGDTWHLNEVFTKINGELNNLGGLSTRTETPLTFWFRNTVTRRQPTASFVSY